MTFKKCCDNCKYYEWYQDYCKKLESNVDFRNICSLWEDKRRNNNNGQ